jgi:hypothetical protein
VTIRDKNVSVGTLLIVEKADDSQQNIAMERYRIAFLFIFGLLIRTVAYIFFEEGVGDGPVRAIIALEWSKDPSIQLYGVWPPGFMYLSGVFNLIVFKSIASTRLLSLVLGSLTIPMFYLIVREAYEQRIAFFSGLVLAVFPLHISLSVASLTEVSFAFELITSMCFLILWAPSVGVLRKIYLGLSISIFIMATMTRYEAWIIIPVWTLFYYCATRHKGGTFLYFLVLVAFPVTWMLSNLANTGSILPVYAEATVGSTVPKTILQTLRCVARLACNYLGWPAVLAGIIGFSCELYRLIKGRLNQKKVVYFATVCALLIFLMKFSFERQMSLGNYGRYYLILYILSIPFVIIPFTRIFKKTLVVSIAVLAMVVCPMMLCLWYQKPQMYVMREHPDQIKHIGSWIENSQFNATCVMTTGPFDTLLKLYNPGCRYFPVVGHPDIAKVQARMKILQPSLLVVDTASTWSTKNKKLIAEKILKARLINKRIKSAGTIEVYDIRDLVGGSPDKEEIELFRRTDYLGGLFHFDHVNEVIQP